MSGPDRIADLERQVNELKVANDPNRRFALPSPRIMSQAVREITEPQERRRQARIAAEREVRAREREQYLRDLPLLEARKADLHALDEQIEAEKTRHRQALARLEAERRELENAPLRETRSGLGGVLAGRR